LRRFLQSVSVISLNLGHKSTVTWSSFKVREGALSQNSVAKLFTLIFKY